MSSFDVWAWSAAFGEAFLLPLACFGALQLGLVFVAVFAVERRPRDGWAALQMLAASSFPAMELGYCAGLAEFELPFLSLVWVGGAGASLRASFAAFGKTHPPRLASDVAIGGALGLAVGLYCLSRELGPALAAATAALYVVASSALQLRGWAPLAFAVDGSTFARLMIAAWGFLLVSLVVLAVGGGSVALSVALLGCLALGAFALIREPRVRLQQTAISLARLEARRGREIAAMRAELRRQLHHKSYHLYAALMSMESGLVEALRPGDIVGPYKVQKRLGIGGMGTVYEVRRISDGEHFALKLSTGLGSKALARMAREAQMAASVVHRNLVAIQDVDLSDQGFLYIVMDLVVGPSLRDVAKHRDAQEVLELLRGIAEGLYALHQAGIVHRDLKPDNVLLELDEHGGLIPRLSDFGVARPEEELHLGGGPDEAGSTAALAGSTPAPVPPRAATRFPSDAPTSKHVGTDRPRAAASSLTNLTQTGSLLGTPAYMAPELLGEGAVSAKVDLFSFGVMAYELLTGRRPYSHPVAIARLAKIDLPEPPPLRNLVDGPPRLLDVLDACRSIDPERRPGSRELLLAMAGAASGPRRRSDRAPWPTAARVVDNRR